MPGEHVEHRSLPIRFSLWRSGMDYCRATEQSTEEELIIWRDRIRCGMGWGSDSLYDHAVDDWFEDYDRTQIKGRLLPYLKYLKDVMKHYREHPLAVIECKLDSGNPQDKPHGGAWLDLSGAAADGGAGRAPGHPVGQRRDKPPEHDERLDPHLLEQIMDPEKTQYVWEYGGRNKGRIKIIDRDESRMMLKLERKPGTEKVQILRDTYSLYRQKEAVGSLLYRPELRHKTLLKLFHDRDRVELDATRREKIKKWFLLVEDREGSALQREFVEKALGTPDFAFLEGPPGSGKTTVLCELVLQLVSRRKRVLFCASTHVAVDNLLERLDGTDAAAESNLIPLRIGESKKISYATSKYTYKNVTETWRKHISKRLSTIPTPNEAQKNLMDILKHDDTIGQIARDCANLVCGTTIGILQHPDIRDGAFYGMFDVLIMDEASKTTFQEFLVPAMHAGRWIIAGDTKQLAPHTEQAEIGLHVDRCVDRRLGQVCHDVFAAGRRRCLMEIAVEDHTLKETYQTQCKKLGVGFVDADGDGWQAGVAAAGTPKGMIVAGSAPSLSKAGAGKPDDTDSTPDAAEVRPGTPGGAGGQVRRSRDRERFRAAERHPRDDQDVHAWGSAVAWRAGMLPLGGRDLTKGEEAILQDIEDLMPAGDEEYKDAKTKIDAVRSIALPSILQLLQYGHRTDMEETVMARGIPEKDFGSRHVLLEYQYRMHPDIAAFAERNVYDGAALKTPQSVRLEREWRYGRYGSRLAWIDIPGSGRGYASEMETRRIASEVRIFCEWARKNPRRDGKPWEVAVLAFYTRQVDTIRPHLARLAGNGGPHTFHVQPGKGTPVATIELRTLDSFQGHEADMVFLSVARSRPTVFLENPNRVNVAITRARYQQVIVGDRRAMARSDSLLGRLAGDAHVEGAGDG